MTTNTFSPTALKGRTVLVTGASSGIGREVAIRLSNIGAKVLATGRDLARLTKTMGLLRPGNHEYLQVDLTTPGGIEEVRFFIENQENLYGFVHAAGSQKIKPLRTLDPGDYRDMYEIHLIAAAEIMRRIVNKIGRNRGGSIVFLSSVSSIRGAAGIGAYAAAKAAVVSLTKSSALELSGLGIRVNCLVPGMVHSSMSEKLVSRLPADRGESLRIEHPLGIGTPSAVADPVIFLLSDAAIWITGSVIPVDGGFLAG